MPVCMYINWSDSAEAVWFRATHRSTAVLFSNKPGEFLCEPAGFVLVVPAAHRAGETLGEY